MDARLARAAAIAAALVCFGASLGWAASCRTPNFIVTAPTQALADQIARQAEKYRRDLAIEWLGQALPNWLEPCPITAQVSAHLGAGGATSFVFDHGQVFGWRMTIQGSQERVLDSVLPHEVTHTVFASHFRRPLPRWADEGACTTVEHASERNKQQRMLIDFLRNKRGIPFHVMFAMKEYPQDILPLYAQGHSLASFLIAQGGRKKFINFVATGLENEQWSTATRQVYGYAGLANLQSSWLDWVRKGSPAQLPPKQPAPAEIGSANALAQAAPRPRPEGDTIYRNASAPAALAAEPLVPVNLPRRAAVRGGATQLASAAAANNQQSARVADGWRAKGAARDDSATESNGPTYNQLTRPQGNDAPRQVILEWERPSGASAPAANRTAPRAVVPQPAADDAPPAPRRSIYDVRRHEPGVMLR